MRHSSRRSIASSIRDRKASFIGEAARPSTTPSGLRRQGVIVSRMDFHNSTDLDTDRLLALVHEAADGWATGPMTVRVRFSRSADFSGTCFYATQRIFINVGRHLRFPYQMGTHVARARTVGRRWYKPVYALTLRHGYDLVLFVFLHELYHLLVKRARRNTRQKESMCDRFATRFLVDRYDVKVLRPDGHEVPREEWDFQDLDGFVSGARERRGTRPRSTEHAARHAAIGDH